MSGRSLALLAMIATVAGTCMLSMSLRGQQANREGQERSPELAAKLQEMHNAIKAAAFGLGHYYTAGNIQSRQLHKAPHERLEIAGELVPAERLNVLSEQSDWAAFFAGMQRAWRFWAHEMGIRSDAVLPRFEATSNE